MGCPPNRVNSTTDNLCIAHSALAELLVAWVLTRERLATTLWPIVDRRAGSLRRCWRCALRSLASGATGANPTLDLFALRIVARAAVSHIHFEHVHDLSKLLFGLRRIKHLASVLACLIRGNAAARRTRH